MTIRRAIPNVLSDNLQASRAFYTGLLGFEVAMDEIGFLMVASPSNRTAQVILCSRDVEMMDPLARESRMSVEVADVDAVYAQAVAEGQPIVYPLTDEPWGIRRFFVRDPDGTVINVNSHIANLPPRT